jgi:hypothetical protein
VKAVNKWLGTLLLAIMLGVAGVAAGAWTAGCSSPPKKARKTQPRVEKKKPDGKDRAVKPRHLPHEHAHPHPHDENDHHHHAHPHPHLPGQNGHHHPY